jgi:nitroimidazol reductase NimA-like FMN-containing flavoprotein (pyridoxamine 5'-phosphate oxidase superfamily)
VSEPDLAAVARAIIDANLYMVLGTADEAGGPWVSPVYFAQSGFREFFWVSSPNATHSRNLAARPGISIVIFDSQTPIDTGQAVYISAHAEEVSEQDGGPGIEIFSRRSQQHGGRPWSLEDVKSPARLRLYRATASAHYVLDERDQRVPVNL